MQNRLMTRLALCLMLAGFCLWPLSGCDGNVPDTGKKTAVRPRAGLLLYKADDAYIAAVTAAIKKSFPDTMDLIIKDGQADPLLQRNQLDALLDEGVGVLIINMVDPKEAAVFLAKAKKNACPVIFFNREPDMALLSAHEGACFVGTHANDAGKMQGDLIYRIWQSNPAYDRNGDGKCQYILFQGEADNPEALSRSEYSVKQARQNGVDMVPVSGPHVCNWDARLAEQAMDAAFEQDGEKIEFVISNNDAMALGALAAMARYGCNLENGPPDKFIPVIGIDAILPAVEAIQKGRMSATVKQDSDAMARIVSQLAVNAVQGRDFLDGTGYRWETDSRDIRIPYAPYQDIPEE